MLLIAQLLIAATSLGLALNGMASQPTVWLIFVLVVFQQAFAGLDVTTRSAAIPKLVGADNLPAAAALNQLLMQVGTVVGPAIGGVLIAKVSISSAYWFDCASFGVAIAALVAMKPMRPVGGGTRASASSIVEGLRFLKGRQALQGTFVIDINAMIFGMPRALFPAIGTAFGGPFAVGLLYAAPGAGAIVGAVTSGWVTRVDRQGRATIIAVIVWGASIAAFGLSNVLWLSLVLLAAAGAADVVSAVFRNTIMQLSVPDRLRGRLSSVHVAVVTGGPAPRRLRVRHGGQPHVAADRSGLGRRGLRDRCGGHRPGDAPVHRLAPPRPRRRRSDRPRRRAPLGGVTTGCDAGPVPPDRNSRRIDRSQLPDEFTPETVRAIDMRTARALANPSNGVLTPTEQQAFYATLREVMKGSAERLGRAGRRRPPDGTLDLDPDLRRSYQRTQRRLEAQAQRARWAFPSWPTSWPVPRTPSPAMCRSTLPWSTRRPSSRRRARRRAHR